MKDLKVNLEWMQRTVKRLHRLTAHHASWKLNQWNHSSAVRQGKSTSLANSRQLGRHACVMAQPRKLPMDPVCSSCTSATWKKKKRDRGESSSSLRTQMTLKSQLIEGSSVMVIHQISTQVRVSHFRLSLVMIGHLRLPWKAQWHQNSKNGKSATLKAISRSQIIRIQ